MRTNQRDRQADLVPFRTITTNDAAIDRSALQRVTLEAAGSLLHTDGAQNVEFRLWGSQAASANSNDTSCMLYVVGWPKAYAKASAGFNGPAGVLLGQFAVTFGSLATTNLNPITGANVATRVFYEADTVVPASGTSTTAGDTDGKLGNCRLYAADGTDREARILIDPDGMDLYAYVDTLATVTRVDIATRLVS